MAEDWDQRPNKTTDVGWPIELCQACVPWRPAGKPALK